MNTIEKKNEKVNPTIQIGENGLRLQDFESGEQLKGKEKGARNFV